MDSNEYENIEAAPEANKIRRDKTEVFTMVEDPNFDNWVQHQRHEIENEDILFAIQKDQEYATLLKSIEKVMNSQVGSFDSLNEISTDTISDKITQLAEVIAADGRDDAREYAISALLEQRTDIDFESLVELFLRLPHDQADVSGARGYIANIINDKVDPLHTDEYLNLFDNSDLNPEDVAILYGGLRRVKGYNDRVQSIIKHGLTSRATVWAAADAAKARKIKELLPYLKVADSRFRNDKDIHRRIKQVEQYLEKI
jgi:hypothetical protein